jgi:hypothetical protein
MMEHVSSTLDDLLGELADRYARGDELDLAGLIEQAGDDADRFAELADRFLEAAPRREPTDAARAYVRALDEPPLLRLRVRRRLKVAAVVTALAKALQVADVTRLQGYYQRLEGGLLDPGRVDGRVWNALETILDAPASVLAQPRGPAAVADGAFLRRAESKASASLAPTDESAFPGGLGVTADPAPAERDELDRLFLGAD